MKATSWIWVLLLSTCLWADSVDLLFNRGVQAYERGDYREAAQWFEEAARQGLASPALYYNLGNAYFKLEDIGRAVLNYERAKKMAPRDEDVLFNLGVAQLRVADKIASPEFDVIYKTFNGIKTALTLSQWMHVTLALYVLLFVCLIALYLDRKRFAFVRYLIRPTAALLLVAALFFALNVRDDLTIQEAVVLSPSVDVRSGPQRDATEVFTLHAGVKVRVLDRSAGFMRIRLSDGKDGWIPADALELI